MGNIFSNENDEEHEHEEEQEEEERQTNTNSFFNWFGSEEPSVIPPPINDGKKRTKSVKFDDKFTFDDEGLRTTTKQQNQKTRKRRTVQKNKTKARRY